MSEIENISNQDDDLSGMAPKLSKLKANSPFKANDDYFEKFSSKLQNRIDDFEETNVDAPVLSNMAKYREFEVPADYFDELPTRIQQLIIDNKPSSSILEWLILLAKPRFVFPVLTVVLIAVAGINFMNKNAESSKTEVAEEISVEDQLANIDESTIIESLTADASKENEKISTEDNSIENYLIDNGVDESSITKM
jgi:chromatin segregation and condensation protein Rec8/ScpA/Scc1 (kleisin family)